MVKTATVQVDDGTVPGDANDNGVINALDITKTERLVAGWTDYFASIRASFSDMRTKLSDDR